MDIEMSETTPPPSGQKRSPKRMRRSAVTAEDEDLKIDDEYAQAWYELGSPMASPFFAYLIPACVSFVDNFFLIKNTYNALTDTEYSRRVSYPKSIAASIVALHILSSILISFIDSLNKDAIGGHRGRYLNQKHKHLILFRMLAHVTLTMKLFRYTTAYLENRRSNVQLHTLRMRRSNISKKEIQFVVEQKKNQLVESHYDLVESFFKTVPAALLQVYFMFKSNPHARLSLYSQTDQDRFATVFFTVISASIGVVYYQSDYLTYKKVLHFQDCFQSKFQHEINMIVPSTVYLISNIPVQILTVGIRMGFYSALIFWSPLQFVIAIGIILAVNWIITFVWNATAWRFRPVLENPLYGLPWVPFDIIDLWINLFVPGVHYPKPIDHFLNFYTTLITGVVVFQGLDFLSPVTNGDSTLGLVLPEWQATLNVTNPNEHDSNSINDALLIFNNNSVPENSRSNNTRAQDPLYFVGSVVKILVKIHTYLTFNQISYAGFFYSVVKYMNIVNFICFGYTCLMNHLKIYDHDFPVQIVNAFYSPIFNSLHTNKGCMEEGSVQEQQGMPFILKKDPKLRSETFLIFSMLRNSRFFGNIRTVLQSKWDSVDHDYLDKMVETIIKEGNELQHCPWPWLDKLANAASPILYPARFREPRYNWHNISTDLEDIIASVNGHPLEAHLTNFIHDVYPSATENRKILLAVFCAHYNDIVRHYTSLRLKKTFEFFDIPIQKSELEKDLRVSRGMGVKHDWELGYWQRLIRQCKGEVETPFS